MGAGEEKAKRWRIRQFSLRTLLLLMFGAACFFGGWTANELKREREMREVQQVPVIISQPVVIPQPTTMMSDDIRRRIEFFERLRGSRQGGSSPSPQSGFETGFGQTNESGLIGTIQTTDIDDNAIPK